MRRNPHKCGFPEQTRYAVREEERINQKKVFKNRKYFTLLSNLLPAVRPQSANNIGTPGLSVSSKVSYTNRSHLGIAEMDIRVINLGTY